MRIGTCTFASRYFTCKPVGLLHHTTLNLLQFELIVVVLLLISTLVWRCVLAVVVVVVVVIVVALMLPRACTMVANFAVRAARNQDWRILLSSPVSMSARCVVMMAGIGVPCIGESTRRRWLGY